MKTKELFKPPVKSLRNSFLKGVSDKSVRFSVAYEMEKVLAPHRIVGKIPKDEAAKELWYAYEHDAGFNHNINQLLRDHGVNTSSRMYDLMRDREQ